MPGAAVVVGVYHGGSGQNLAASFIILRQIKLTRGVFIGGSFRVTLVVD